MRKMTTRQYIGARYIPKFADPVEWTNERTYEPLMMVQHLGETYMTKQAVPLGVQLPDTSQGEESNEFWVHMSNWNAQVETYRQEVLQYNDRIATVENDLPTSEFSSTDTVKDAIDGLGAIIPASDFSSTNTVKSAIENIASDLSDLENIIPATDFDSTNTVKKEFEKIDYAFRSDDNIVFFGDSTMVTNPSFSPSGSVTSIPDLVKQMCDATVVNRAVGGSQTSQVYNTIAALSASDLADATYIVLACGTNDWQAGNTPVRVINAATDVFNIQYRKCLLKLIELAPQAQIICVTPAYGRSQSSSMRGINTNKAGNNIITYCDVIAKEAGDLNIPVLRLDKQMGINQNNYMNKMVPSGATGEAATIYVHYNQDTNEKIARMLVNGIYQTNNEYTETAREITPFDSWYSMDNSTEFYYNFGAIHQINIPVGGKDFTLPTLMSNEHYYISYFSKDVTEIEFDGEIICKTERTGFHLVELPSKQSTFSGTITIKKAVSGSDAVISQPRLWLGRPNFYTAMNTSQIQNKVKRFETTNFHYTLVNFGGLGLIFGELANTFTYTSGAIDNISNNVSRYGEFFGTAVAGGSVLDFRGRLDTNGEMNLLKSSDFANKSITSAKFFIVYTSLFYSTHA